MTKRNRRRFQSAERYQPKAGADHELDDLTGSDFERTAAWWEKGDSGCAHEHRRRVTLKDARGKKFSIPECVDCGARLWDIGHVRSGIAGISEPWRSAFLAKLIAIIDREIAHAHDRLKAPEKAGREVLDKVGLTPAQHEAVVRVLEGSSLRQTAEELGVSRRAIQFRLFWARRKFESASLDKSAP